MEDLTSIIIYILIGSIGLVIGAVVGALIANQFANTEPPGPKRSRSLVEVARIWQDRRNKAIHIEIGGEIYTSPENLSVKHYTGLSRLLEEMHTWLGIPNTEKASPIASIPPRSASSISPPISRPVEETFPAKAQPASSVLVTPLSTPLSPLPREAKSEEAPAIPEEVKPTSVNPIEAFARAFRPKPKEESPLPKSIAVQIDEILQEKLLQTPLRNHVIRLLELPERGMVVVVDSERYDGVNEVPDPDIRALLQACVAEWERRTSS